MAEAVEIAKLRLFLKLAAELDDKSQLEPLPDLDFNIKCGNLLVGIAHAEDLERRFVGRGVLPFGMDAATEAARSAAVAYDEFVAAQAADTGTQMNPIPAGHEHAKERLKTRIRAIADQADEALHEMRNESQGLNLWRDTHKPFHWFAEFPSVWREGGFDVIVGNPPYIDIRGQKRDRLDYQITGYATQNCPNLYAVCTERAADLLNKRGRFAMIVMHSLCFNKDFESLRIHLADCFSKLWVSSYAKSPDSLFSGSAGVRNSIIVASITGNSRLMTSRCRRWFSIGRSTVFATLEYTEPHNALLKCGPTPRWPFTDSDVVSAAFARMAGSQDCLSEDLAEKSNSNYPIKHKLSYKQVAYNSLGVFVVAPPILNLDGTPAITTSTEGSLYFESENQRDLAFIMLASRWAYLWWMMYGDEFHVTQGVLTALPCDIERLIGAASLEGVDPHALCDMELEILYGCVNELLAIADELKEELPNHLKWQTNAGVRVGRYDLRECRHITDRADWLLAQVWGIEDAFEAAGNLRDRMTFGTRG